MGHPVVNGFFDLLGVPFWVGAADLVADHGSHEVPAGCDHLDRVFAALATKDVGDWVVDDFEAFGKQRLVHGFGLYRGEGRGKTGI